MLTHLKNAFNPKSSPSPNPSLPYPKIPNPNLINRISPALIEPMNLIKVQQNSKSLSVSVHLMNTNK